MDESYDVFGGSFDGVNYSSYSNLGELPPGFTGINKESSLEIVDLTQHEKDEVPYVLCKLPLVFYDKVLNFVKERVAKPESTQKKSPVNTPQIHSNVPQQRNISNNERRRKSYLVKGNWTRQEDEHLLQLVKVHGARKWSFIATHLKGRVGKQCRERYLNHLDPNINKTDWSLEEDQKILKLHRDYGNSWSRMAKHFVGRTPNMIKNRWNSTLKKRVGENERENGRRRKGRKRGRKKKKRDSSVRKKSSPRSSNNSSEKYDLKQFENPSTSTLPLVPPPPPSSVLGSHNLLPLPPFGPSLLFHNPGGFVGDHLSTFFLPLPQPGGGILRDNNDEDNMNGENNDGAEEGDRKVGNIPDLPYPGSILPKSMSSNTDRLFGMAAILRSPGTPSPFRRKLSSGSNNSSGGKSLSMSLLSLDEISTSDLVIPNPFPSPKQLEKEKLQNSKIQKHFQKNDVSGKRETSEKDDKGIITDVSIQKVPVSTVK